MDEKEETRVEEAAKSGQMRQRDWQMTNSYWVVMSFLPDSF